MTDPRVTRLARLLIDYSTELKSGETVLLDMIDVPDAMAIELMRAARDAGAIPIVEVRHSRITREVMKDTTEAHAATVRDIELQRMKKMDAYIAIRGSANANEASDIPADRLALYNRTLRPVLNFRV